VNPIDFENAEGNLGVANALLGHLAEKLPVSRWQRDLSDSTVLRTLGQGLGHALLAIRAALRGMGKLAVDADRLAGDLAANPAVLGEAVQTVMRRHGIPDPYEKLKAATRGQEVGLEDLARLIAGLELPESVKQELLALTPARYVGLSARLARRFAEGR
jgi:adenylosuccinate lyase